LKISLENVNYSGHHFGMNQIKFRFNFQKALQATAWLLRLAGGRMPYWKLLKLLCIAEREYLVDESEMIFGDRVVAMKYGPVLSNVCLLANRSPDGPIEDLHLQVQ